MRSDPALVIFNSHPDAPLLPVNGDLVVPWTRGPSKIQSYVRKGRPRKTPILQTHNTSSLSEDNKASDDFSYEFVNFVEDGKRDHAQEQKRIRSHVMRHSQYKRLGYQKGFQAPKIQSIHATSDPHCSNFNRRGDLDLLTTREFLSFDPFDCLRVKFQPYMLDVLSKYTTCMAEAVWPMEVFSGTNPMRDYFLPLALEDGAFLDAIMFSADTIRYMVPEFKEVPNALLHHARCIKAVNERLSTSRPVVDDSTLLIVATMAFVENHIGHHSNWMIHMQGLQHLVALRGGLKALQHNRILYSKLLRVDISGSICNGNAPFFGDQYVPLQQMESPGEESSEHLVRLRQRFQLSGEISEFVAQVEHLTVSLNKLYLRDKSVNAMDLRDSITACQFGLLRCNHLKDDSYQSHINHVWRSSLLLYLISLTYDLPPGVTACDTLATSIRTSIDSLPVGTESFLPPRLWLAFLVGTMSTDLDVRAWADEVFRTVASCNEYYVLDQVKLELGEFLWVDAIHAKGLKWYWNKVMRC